MQIVIIAVIALAAVVTLGILIPKWDAKMHENLSSQAKKEDKKA